MQKIKSFFYLIIFLAAIGGGGYFIYQNPKIIEETAAKFNNQKEINSLQAEVESLRKEVLFLQNNTHEKVDLSGLDAKLERMEKQNISIIDSKADIATVLGLVTRLDKMESKVDTVAKVSDSGALILNALMLVKDRADRGEEFAFEAEILRQMTAKNQEIAEPVKVIAAASETGISTERDLINGFESIYKKTGKKEETEKLSWKQRLMDKFKEIVQIRKTNLATDNEDNSLDLAREDVLKGNFSGALKKMENSDNPSFEGWKAKARQRVEFESAFSKISAGSLALMKINQLKEN